MMIVTVSTLSDLLIILCSSDLSIWEKIVFNDQNLCLVHIDTMRLLEVPPDRVSVLGVSKFCIVYFPQSKKYFSPMKFRNCLYRLWFLKCKYNEKSGFGIKYRDQA